MDTTTDMTFLGLHSFQTSILIIIKEEGLFERVDRKVKVCFKG
jgi:hypothetical protein